MKEPVCFGTVPNWNRTRASGVASDCVPVELSGNRLHHYLWLWRFVQRCFRQRLLLLLQQRSLLLLADRLRGIRRKLCSCVKRIGIRIAIFHAISRSEFYQMSRRINAFFFASGKYREKWSEPEAVSVGIPEDNMRHFQRKTCGRQRKASSVFWINAHVLLFFTSVIPKKRVRFSGRFPFRGNVLQ